MLGLLVIVVCTVAVGVLVEEEDSPDATPTRRAVAPTATPTRISTQVPTWTYIQPTRVPRRPTATPRRPTATPQSVSQSVKEGCAGAALIREMIISDDISGLTTFGPGSMQAMTNTSDGILNLNGNLVAVNMLDFSEYPTQAALDNILDGLDAYIETCKNLTGR